MTLVQDLLTRASEYLPQDRVDSIKDAYAFAKKAHQGQMRLSGEPFVHHPLHTALYLVELKLDANALAAALLHDVMEDCDVSHQELSARFGEEVAGLVDGVTKLTKTELIAEEGSGDSGNETDARLSQAASLRKMLMTMSEDVRVVIIKLADRLHNMRTLSHLPEARRTAIAKETLDIYAPLAHRLGIWEIKWRLEDLAFQVINPVAYRNISRLLSSKRVEREKYVKKVIDILQLELERAGIKAEVTGRPKHIYSIHKKMQAYKSRNLEAGEIYDLFALRVLVEDVANCYAALGVTHTKWRPLPGQFDDYLANPKDNLYQSLHTAVLCENASPVEVQIRTHEMHNLAEYGVASHWLYKEGKATDQHFEQKMAWLRQLLEWHREVGGAEEFVESFKTDIFQDQVFVYTPKRELKELPAGATPLDFGYRIHSDIGHSCIGAKVNGKLVPLHYRLENGDTVEILTSETVGGPSPEWINPDMGYVKTAYARERLRQWFNRQTRRANIKRGREVFKTQILRLDSGLDEQKVARLMGFDRGADLLSALGSGTIGTAQVVNKLSSMEVKPQEVSAVALPSTGPGSGVEVLGVGDLHTRIAHCCTPIKGDEIVGYITRSRGVTVHRGSCPNVQLEDQAALLVPVSWGEALTLYPVRIFVEAWDRVGLLRDVTSLVSDERVNIASCVSEEHGDTSIITLTVYTDGIDQLSRLFSKLERVEGVRRVARAKSG